LPLKDKYKTKSLADLGCLPQDYQLKNFRETLQSFKDHDFKEPAKTVKFGMELGDSFRTAFDKNDDKVLSHPTIQELFEMGRQLPYSIRALTFPNPKQSAENQTQDDW